VEETYTAEERQSQIEDARDLPKRWVVENIADELAEISRLHGVSVLILEHRPELLAKYGGVAAVRYVVPQLGAEEEAEKARGQSA
jgi:hypothetical protein